VFECNQYFVALFVDDLSFELVFDDETVVDLVHFGGKW
jgi:hypothetical protein